MTDTPIFFILALMVMFHIVDDYYLQGILASMKQKKWWEDQCTTIEEYNKYRYDYIVALACHGFSWAFMIMLPIVFYKWGNLTLENYVMPLIINTVIHGMIDNAKANDRSINLIQDQSFHLIQIVLTWINYCILS